MLNKDISEIRTRLREDCPDFYALEEINCNLATQIAYWIKEDRTHTVKRTVKNTKRAIKRKESRKKR